MNKTLTTLVFLALPLMVQAQKVTYAYDAAGNRIKREIVLQTRPVPQSENTEMFSDLISGKNVHISPNPTKGILKIDIPGKTESDQCELSLYNLEGRLLIKNNVETSHAELDLNLQKNGIYILRLTLNGKNTSWKIIKE